MWFCKEGHNNKKIVIIIIISYINMYWAPIIYLSTWIIRPSNHCIVTDEFLKVLHEWCFFSLAAGCDLRCLSQYFTVGWLLGLLNRPRIALEVMIALLLMLLEALLGVRSGPSAQGRISQLKWIFKGLKSFSAEWMLSADGTKTVKARPIRPWVLPC